LLLSFAGFAIITAAAAPLGPCILPFLSFFGLPRNCISIKHVSGFYVMF
jgi:hypothetical protein